MSYSLERRVGKEMICLLSVFVECTATAVGIEMGEILDSQFVASSGNASLARLNGRFAWCPMIDGYGEYIQVGEVYDIINCTQHSFLACGPVEHSFSFFKRIR